MDPRNPPPADRAALRRGADRGQRRAHPAQPRLLRPAAAVSGRAGRPGGGGPVEGGRVSGDRRGGQGGRGTVYFADEAGVRSDYHAGTTWAPVGATPTVLATGARFALNMISAISAQAGVPQRIGTRAHENAA